ncbi:MAG TPA: nuclear transport factor 2 family protein [Casimicrobiaceae bacterium]|nr:nuclear transport factor 2 family protein [Casimicrobiaceae bacterium]
MSGAEAVVQRQLEAYNARDLARFLAEYSDDIRAYRLPATEPAIDGKEAFGRFYATQRFNHVRLHAELVNRMVLGNNVIDHERISGVTAQVIEVAVVYEVSDGLIQRTWAFAAA